MSRFRCSWYSASAAAWGHVFCWKWWLMPHFSFMSKFEMTHSDSSVVVFCHFCCVSSFFYHFSSFWNVWDSRLVAGNAILTRYLSVPGKLMLLPFCHRSRLASFCDLHPGLKPHHKPLRRYVHISDCLHDWRFSSGQSPFRMSRASNPTSLYPKYQIQLAHLLLGLLKIGPTSHSRWKSKSYFLKLFFYILIIFYGWPINWFSYLTIFIQIKSYF